MILLGDHLLEDHHQDHLLQKNRTSYKRINNKTSTDGSPTLKILLKNQQQDTNVVNDNKKISLRINKSIIYHCMGNLIDDHHQDH